MTDGNLVATVIVKLLDWPFLLFILIGVIFREYHVKVVEWMTRISEVDLVRGKLMFTIGKDKVTLDQIDIKITARLQDLEKQIEHLKANVNLVDTDTVVNRGASSISDDFLAKQIYPMLKSKLWKGRYVETIADTLSISVERVLMFCKSRDNIVVFKAKESGKLGAILEDRLDEFDRNTIDIVR